MRVLHRGDGIGAGTAPESGGRIDVESFSLTLQGRYQINTWMAALAGYTYFMQRPNSPRERPNVY